MTDELLQELIAEVRGLRADLRRQRADAGRTALLRELATLDCDTFTAAGILDAVEDDLHSPLADAVAACIDMNGTPRSRVTALGLLLAKLDLELVGDRRGAAVYRLRTCS